MKAETPTVIELLQHIAELQTMLAASDLDAKRYAMLFQDTWREHKGIAIFCYIRSHEYFERLCIEEANTYLDAAIAKAKK